MPLLKSTAFSELMGLNVKPYMYVCVYVCTVYECMYLVSCLFVYGVLTLPITCFRKRKKEKTGQKMPEL